VRGLIYDGLSARGRTAAVTIEFGVLAISYADGSIERISLSTLARGVRSPERITVHRDDAPDWRLVIAEPNLPRELSGLRPVGRFRGRTVAVYTAVSLALIMSAASLWAGGDRILDVIVSVIPHRPLEKLGNAMVKGIGSDRRCNAPDGQAALERLLTRLRPPQGFVEPIRVSVADVDTINAFAAPGGQIVILRGLIDQAKSPDEVAGVLAHELTHVQLHHPTKALIRAVGLSTLVQSLGGQTGALMNEAVLLSGTRDAERAADAGALQLLAGARISPVGLADFFRRMGARKPAHNASRGDALIDRLGGFMASHPGNGERLSAIDRAGKGEGETTPAMSDDDWKSLRTICKTDGEP
jgi:Zn-dependent protease with chaperone function